jgi:Uma2 family endonuclease
MEDAMASATSVPRFTAEQYLALERRADSKSEFCNGFMIAMAGGSRERNVIAGNLHGEIRSQLKERPCEVYISDMRVRVNPTGLFTYPDVIAVCGEACFLDDKADTVLNSTLIAEVLSSSTESYDRGDKFMHYRRLESLREYVLVSQDKVLVERFTRQGDQWLLTEFRTMDETLRLDSIDCAVPLREIYARIELPGQGATGD